MLHDTLHTLLEALEVVGPAFTRPGFDNLLVVFAGAVLVATASSAATSPPATADQSAH
jgi:hypothetical protein